VYQYAIYVVHSLVGRLPSPIDDRNPVVRYLCALFSELAYYHIPQWEIDDKKRAKLIPCNAYQALVARGRSTNLNTLFQQLDLPRGFAVADRGVVAVGLVLNRLLFIGFRGTQFLFDWRMNLRSKLVPVNARFRMRDPFVFSTISGRLHSGLRRRSHANIDPSSRRHPRLKPRRHRPCLLDRSLTRGCRSCNLRDLRRGRANICLHPWGAQVRRPFRVRQPSGWPACSGPPSRRRSTDGPTKGLRLRRPSV
jgi:hypothetical protein